MDANDKHILTKAIQRQVRGDTPRERLLHRLHSIVLVLNGRSASEVAGIYGDSPRAVAYWVSRFKEEGIAGLEEHQRPGRPSKLDARQVKTLQTFLKRAKHKSKPINARALAAFIVSEFGISLTARQCWRILNKFKS
jgi:transposase